MIRPTVNHHIDPYESLVPQGRFHVHRLGHDAGIRGESLQHLGGAHAGVLFIGNTAHDDIAGRILGIYGGAHHRRHTAFHIVGTASKQLAIPDFCGERIAIVPGQRDGIVVSIEHERFAATASPADADNRRPTGHLLQPLRFQAVMLKPRHAVIGDFAFASRSGNE